MSSDAVPFGVIDVTVFRRSDWWPPAWLVGGVESLFADALLESHEKGMDNFLSGGAGLAECGLGGGGGPQGTAGKLPERPWERKGNFGGGPEAFTLASVEVIVVDLDLVEDTSFISSSWTSSNDDDESRRVVSNGEFDGGSLEAENMVSVSGGFVAATEAASIVSDSVERRGVEVEEEERGRSVRDRVDADDLDGCEVMSGASSNVSW